MKVTDSRGHHFFHECSKRSMKRYFDKNNSRFNGQQKVIRAGNFWGMHNVSMRKMWIF
jgi:hypothetical protein